MTKAEFIALIDRYLSGEASDDEIAFLDRYYNSFQQDGWNEDALGVQTDMEARMFANIRERINGQAPTTVRVLSQEPDADHDEQAPVVSLRSRLVKWVGVAACATGLAWLGWHLYPGTPPKTLVARVETQKPAPKADVQPGSNKAVLTLSDGSTIVLDDAQNGTLAKQGNTKVIKLGGKLAYNAAAGNSAPQYNTISTPRGGQYQVELPDKSEVWLNAESSLRFPTAFVGAERRVEINGEAYFEVAKNKAMPFVVSVAGSEVHVLGTHFNVMAYREEPLVKTTLLEGSVKLMNNGKTALLKPGEQSQLGRDGQLKVVSGVDVEQVVAWKNGLFQFDNADLETVMQQLARWYDVDVVYNTKVRHVFVGEMPRSSRLCDVLKALELTSNLHFEMDQRKIIVQ